MIGLVWLCTRQQVWACSCTHSRLPLAEEFQAVDVIIKATVLRQEMIISPLTNPYFRKRLAAKGLQMEVDSSLTGEDMAFARYTVKVKRCYKGQFESTIASVITGLDEGACGVEFEIGKTYLIYAGGKHNRLGASICSRTRRYNWFEAQELAKLQRQAHPAKPAARKRPKVQRKAAAK